MTVTSVAISLFTIGRNRLAESSTHPSAALVTMYTLPNFFDCCISERAAVSSSSSFCLRAAGNFTVWSYINSWWGARKVVQRMVSSQSNIMHVWWVVGLSAGLNQTFLYVRLARNYVLIYWLLREIDLTSVFLFASVKISLSFWAYFGPFCGTYDRPLWFKFTSCNPSVASDPVWNLPGRYTGCCCATFC